MQPGSVPSLSSRGAAARVPGPSAGLSRRLGPRADRPLAWFADLPLAGCIYSPAALAGLLLPYALLPSAGRPARAGAGPAPRGAGPGAGAPLRAHLLGVAAAHAGLAAAVTAAGAKSGFLPAGWALCALAAAAVAPDEARRLCTQTFGCKQHAWRRQALAESCGRRACRRMSAARVQRLRGSACAQKKMGARAAAGGRRRAWRAWRRRWRHACRRWRRLRRSRPCCPCLCWNTSASWRAQCCRAPASTRPRLSHAKDSARHACGARASLCSPYAFDSVKPHLLTSVRKAICAACCVRCREGSPVSPRACGRISELVRARARRAAGGRRWGWCWATRRRAQPWASA
jgi:hypothetical protein